MAARKPIVVNSGELQQLQAGDTLDAPVTGGDVVSLTPAATLIAGAIVYISAADACNKAKADASGTSIAFGLAVAAITSGVAGFIKTDGLLSLTTGEWDAVFGTTGGLTAGTQYYLSKDTASFGTATAPSAVGQYVVYIGLGVSTTELMIALGRRLLL